MSRQTLDEQANYMRAEIQPVMEAADLMAQATHKEKEYDPEEARQRYRATRCDLERAAMLVVAEARATALRHRHGPDDRRNSLCQWCGRSTAAEALMARLKEGA